MMDFSEADIIDGQVVADSSHSSVDIVRRLRAFREKRALDQHSALHGGP
jgi:hypothetical protein